MSHKEMKGTSKQVARGVAAETARMGNETAAGLKATERRKGSSQIPFLVIPQTALGASSSLQMGSRASDKKRKRALERPGYTAQPEKRRTLDVPKGGYVTSSIVRQRSPASEERVSHDIQDVSDVRRFSDGFYAPAAPHSPVILSDYLDTVEVQSIDRQLWEDAEVQTHGKQQDRGYRPRLHTPSTADVTEQSREEQAHHTKMRGEYLARQERDGTETYYESVYTRRDKIRNFFNHYKSSSSQEYTDEELPQRKNKETMAFVREKAMARYPKSKSNTSSQPRADREALSKVQGALSGPKKKPRNGAQCQVAYTISQDWTRGSCTENRDQFCALKKAQLQKERKDRRDNRHEEDALPTMSLSELHGHETTLTWGITSDGAAWESTQQAT